MEESYYSETWSKEKGPESPIYEEYGESDNPVFCISSKNAKSPGTQEPVSPTNVYAYAYAHMPSRDQTRGRPRDQPPKKLPEQKENNQDINTSEHKYLDIIG